MPEISIIVPVYKVEDYLSQCIESILKQSFTDFEVICVNDGSPDRCDKILEKYAQKDSRIKVITQKNQGVSAARNTGLKAIKGRYITFIDSDDEIAPTFLETMYHIVKEKNADIVSCNVEQGKTSPSWISTNLELQEFTKPFESYISGKIKTYAAIWGKLYKKEVLNQFSFEPCISQAGEDLLYLYQVLYQASTFVSTNEKLYFYRERPNSVTTSHLSQRFVFGNIKTAELIKQYFSDKKMSPSVRKILNQKIAKRIFKFAVLEPKRKDKHNLKQWYDLTTPILKKLKENNIYQPRYLNLKNRLKSCIFLRKKK